MKITIYTISDCPFCTKEKEYLTSKNITFEEKNVKENREFLTELLDVSNKFAGVPFTVIEKDGGEKVMLKGFTQSEFDEALGSGTDAGEPAQPPADKEEETAEPKDTAPVSDEKPAPQTPPEKNIPVQDVQNESPAQQTQDVPDQEQQKAQKELDSIMGNLKDQTANNQPQEPTVPTPPVAETPVSAPAGSPTPPAAEQPPVAAPAGAMPQAEAPQTGSAPVSDQPIPQAPEIPDFQNE